MDRIYAPYAGYSGLPSNISSRSDLYSQFDNPIKVWADTYDVPYSEEPRSADQPRTFPLTPHKNYPSVAVKQSLWAHGWIGRVVQLLAISLAAMVTFLCVRETYFMDIGAPRVTLYLQLFQFLAKLHDIVVTASLTEICIYYLTFGLSQTNGVPLGLIMAPFRLSTPSALFEKPYRSSMRVGGSGHITSRDWRTFRFGALLFLGTLITAAIAPLSAILIVPQLAWWDVADAFSSSLKDVGHHTGFTYWDMPYDAIWPSNLDGEHILPSFSANSLQDGCWNDYDCPYYDLNTLMRWAFDSHKMRAPANIPLSEEGNVIRYVTAARLPDIGFAVASTPMSGVSRSLGVMWLWFKRLPVRLASVGRPVITIQSVNDSSPILRPLVQVQCGPPVDVTNKSFMGRYVSKYNISMTDYFANRTNVLLEFPTNKLVPNTGDIEFDTNLTHVVNVLDLERGFDPKITVMGPGVGFVNLAGSNGASAIGAAVAVTFYNLGWSQRVIFPCTMLFHWVPSTTNIDPVAINVVTVVNDPNPQNFINRPRLPPQSRMLNMNASYLQAANSPIADFYGNLFIRWSNSLAFSGNLTLGAFEAMISTMTVGGNDFLGLNDTQWPSLMAMMLSLQSTAGLARYGHHFNMFTWFINATNSSMSTSTNLIDPYNSWYSIETHDNQRVLGKPDTIKSMPENYTQVEWQVQRSGYAWSLFSGYQMAANTLKIVALTVVLGHVLIIIVQYVSFTTKYLRGQKNVVVRWNTPLDLLILALQTPDRYTNRLHGTSTKVNDSSTYRDMVRIEESPTSRNILGHASQSALMTINDPAVDENVRGTRQHMTERGFEMSKGTGSGIAEIVHRRRLRPEVAYL